MTGGGTAPKTFDKEEDLRKFVAETPGAIGFVDSANADASVGVNYARRLKAIHSARRTTSKQFR